MDVDARTYDAAGHEDGPVDYGDRDYKIVEQPDGLITVVVFGGIRGGVGVLPFEFFRSLEGIPVRKVFIRDSNQAWYQSGILGVGGDPGAIRSFLLDNCEPARSVFIGNSMGGYGALLFGQMCHAGRIVSFAPQTFYSPVLRLLHRDFRWKREIRKAQRGGWLDLMDLKTYFARNGTPLSTRIFYPLDYRLDRIHAERLGGVAGVKLEGRRSDAHSLVRDLRDAGHLALVIAEEVAAVAH